MVKSITFSQSYLQKIAIAGASGSGKSTLLKMIAGFIQPDKGEVWFDNKRVKGPDEQLIPGHSAIGYLSQHFELRNNYRVEELLDYASKMETGAANQLYDLCRVSHLLTRRTDQLSGGEKQRIALAGTLSSSPRLLLLDEPFSNLDAMHKNQLKSVINQIGNVLNITCLLVSHDPADLLSWADEMLVMENGRVVQQGTPQQVYHHPVNTYVAELFGPFNSIIDEGVKLKLGIKHSKGNHVEQILRPECFEMNGETKAAMSGIVTAVFFRGGYYDTAVLCEGRQFLVRTLEAPVVTNGDWVTVSLTRQVAAALSAG